MCYVLPLIDVNDVDDLTFKIEQLPWQYQPSKEELEALENLRQMIEYYQQYLVDTDIPKGGK